MDVAVMNAADVAARSTWNANDISPDLKSGQSLRTALEELRKCQKLFDGWAVELDKTANQRKHHLEHQLASSVDNLRDACTTAVQSSVVIMEEYQEFSDTMGNFLDLIANRNTRIGNAQVPRLIRFVNPDREELKRLADSLATQSLLVTELINQIQVQLRDVVTTVLAFEDMVTHRKKVKKFWSWLAGGLGAVAGVLAVASALCPLVLPLTAPVIASFGVAGALAKAGAYLCEKAVEEYSLERFEQVVDQLLSVITKQAEEAEQSLAKAETSHEMVRVELALQMDRFESMRAEEATELRDMWKTQSYLLQMNDDD